MSSLRSQLLRRKPADCVSLRGLADRKMAADTGADDVLVVGSSSLEPVSRVFLCSRPTKILATPRCPSSSLRAVAVEGPTAC